MSPRLRLRNDVCDASAVLGNTAAHTYVGFAVVAAAAAVADVAAVAAEDGLIIRQSLVGGAGIFWMAETQFLCFYLGWLVRTIFDMLKRKLI
jgi:hypothetical protein